MRWGDYDNDGDLDLAIQGFTGGTRWVRLYKNNSGTFMEDPLPGLYAYNEGPMLFGDYDRDGDLDLAYTGWSGGGTGSRIYRNDGGGTFFWLGDTLRGMKGADGAWFDYDNDGDLDLILVGESYDPPSGDYSLIYRNDGNDVFTAAVSLPGVYLGQVAAGDFDNDGDVDLAITGRTVGAKIFRNTGGAFADIGAGLPSLINGAVAWGDFDNDGDLDLAICGQKGDSSLYFEIYQNNAGTFVALNAGLPGIHTGELHWGDYDNDGDPDLLATGLDGAGLPVSRVYRNDGGGVFTDAALGLAGVWDQSSAAWGDYDNDGDLDIVMAGQLAGGTYAVKVYRNDSTVANTAPAPPPGLAASISGDRITFSWNASTDGQTPAAGLTYNLRLGTTPGGQEIMAPMSNLSSGWRRLPNAGNAQHNLSWTIGDLSSGTYYWSVQAVDAAVDGDGTPLAGASLASGPSQIAITFSKAMDGATMTSGTVQILASGGDGTFGDGNEAAITPVSVTCTGTTGTVNLTGINLANDTYRLKIRGTEAAIPDLFAHWRLDDSPSNLTAFDSSGNGRSGTLDGNGSLPVWTPGRLGGGLAFDGGEQRVLVNGGSIPAPWTATLWVYRLDSPWEDARLMDSTAFAVAGSSSLRLESFNNTNRVGIAIYQVGDYPSSYTAPAGSWTHLAFVGSASSTAIYANGMPVDTINAGVPLHIYCLGSHGAHTLKGTLADVRIYTRALSAGEIASIAALGGGLRGSSGTLLDGEFSGSFPSGNGTAGGDFITT
ncbi:MAG: VCBS repeat-containing protein, partial [Nitrospirae bacterium]|nr:VCBS repeat-containing protein [Nitrospirota bacterium]